MTPKAWVNRTTGDLLGNHPISWGYDPSEWEPLYSLDQMRECLPGQVGAWNGHAYKDGWDDCRSIALSGIDALEREQE